MTEAGKIFFKRLVYLFTVDHISSQLKQENGIVEVQELDYSGKAHFFPPLIHPFCHRLSFTQVRVDAAAYPSYLLRPDVDDFLCYIHHGSPTF